MGQSPLLDDSPAKLAVLVETRRALFRLEGELRTLPPKAKLRAELEKTLDFFKRRLEFLGDGPYRPVP